jgi:hypothetical protein
MKQSLLLAGASVASATSLSSICSVEYIEGSLPTSDTGLQGLVYGDVTANSVYNSSVEAGNNYPAADGRNFCNVTVAYSHGGKDDAVSLPCMHWATIMSLIYSNLADQCVVLLSGACPVQRPLPSHRWWRLRHQFWCIWSGGRTRVRSCYWLHRRRHGLGRSTE